MGHSHAHVLDLKNLPEGGRKIVLAGNPNVGKSVFFNALTGLYVDVSNFPGTTLEISHGRYGSDIIIDTPGVYGISSFNDEERIARDIILSADIVVNVVDAVHMERDLFLTQQIIDTGTPVIVALNMIDEAEKLGLNIDDDLLGDLLGVPVIPTIAVKGKGFEELKNSIDKASLGRATGDLEPNLNRLLNRVGSRGEALLILEGDPHIAARHGIDPENLREEIYLKRRERVNDIVSHVMKEISKGTSMGITLGRLMLRPLTGIPILVMALWAMYEVIGVFIAGTVVDFAEEAIFEPLYIPAVEGLVERFMSLESVPGIILAGEFGILTMPVAYVLGLLMPLVIGFYFFLALFEDSGYLPRIAALVDRLLTYMGLNGRAVIPLILGFGCVTMATIVTRMLGSDRERRIAIFLLGLAIPCSAQLGVIAGMLAAIGPQYAVMYGIVIFSVLVMVGTILHRILPGKSSDLLIDLPPLRMPRLDNVLKKTGTKSYSFLKEAAPLFVLGALLISTFQITGVLAFLQNLLTPLTVGLLNLPKETATAFIMGIVRRDFGAAGLTGMALDPMGIVVALITITLFVPCIASILIIFKERTKKEAAIIWASTWIIAFTVGGTVAQLSKLTATSNTAITLIIAFFIIVTVLVTILTQWKRPKETDNVVAGG